MAAGLEIYQRILSQQRGWAELRDIDVCDADCASSIDSNIYRPLSRETSRELARNPGAPLGEPDTDPRPKPAPIQKLDSREALTCSFFDYWRGREIAPLLAACDVTSDGRQLSFAFCAEAEGPNPSDPLIDVLIEGGGRPTAVVTGFAELYQTRRSGTGRGGDIGAVLPGCRALRRNLRANPERFARLPADELLSQADALTRRFGPRGFRLLFLWYESAGDAADRLRAEIDWFRMRAGGEIDFHARTFQEVFTRLHATASGEHRGYTDYLAERYFPTPTT